MSLRFCSKLAIMASLCGTLAFSHLTSYGQEPSEINYEQKLISMIGISGNYPYIESKIRRYLTIRPGDPYNEAVMEEQLDRIKQFYKREGWYHTQVSYRPEYVEDYDAIVVHFKIVRGFLLRYKDINVTGNYSLPRSLVASKINPWKPYSPRRLREGTHKITDVYRKVGYPLARVRVADKEIDLENHTIDVTVEIEEGPYVTVVFKGNEHLGSKHLKKVVTIFSEGAIDTYELEESVKALKNRYKERGFPDTQISFDRKEIEEGRIVITFNINEGKPERIRKIFIEGNEKISSRRIKKQMVSKSLSLTKRGIYDEKVLQNDVKRITYFYRSKGFLDETTGQPCIEKVEDGTQLNIIMPVSENVQTTVKSINFVGDTKFTAEQLQKRLKSKVDRPLDITILDKETESLVTFYADNGYPYVEVNAEVVRDIPTEANLNFNINPGPLVHFGEITISGDFLTSQKAIRKGLGIKEGDIFSYAKLVNGKVGLRRLGAFATVDVTPAGIDQKATTIPLQVKIEELRPFKLDFDLGYSTDENFVGSIDFVNRNSFGWAKRTIFRLTGGRKLSRGEVGWIDPRLGGHDLELITNGWLQFEDKNVFSYVQGGVGVGLYRRYHRTSFWARTTFNRNYLLQGSSTAADAESLRNNTIFDISLSMSFDTRNSFAYPTKGIFIVGYADFFNEIGGTNAHFVTMGLSNGLYYTIFDRITFANDFRVDDIETLGKNVSIPSNELLLLGGDNSLRGFDRNSLGPKNAAGQPTGGRHRLINSTEVRFKLFGNFRWIFFHDMGYLVNSLGQVSLGTLRHSAGFGLHYITPIGPISADYGFILDRQPGEHIGRFHLTFGYRF